MTKVLILMSATGGGHRSVSLALEDALHGLAPGAVETNIVDVFALERRSLLDQTTRLYSPAIRYCPRLYGWSFHLMNRRWMYEHFFAQSAQPLVPKLGRLLRKEKPDIIVNTHPLCNRALLTSLRRNEWSIPVVATVTELVTVHRSWVEPGIECYTAATEEAWQATCNLGAPPERVHLLGLPVNPRFGRVEESPQAIRGKMGLSEDQPTYLVVGGGEGTGGLGRLVEAIDETGVPGQLIVVCGRNQRLQRRLEKRTFRMPAAVIGFAENMPELMHAADVVLMKGGPQSLGEALASGRPIIVTQTLPGQEEGNAELIERRGAGYDGRDLHRALWALKELSSDPRKRHEMARNAAKLARPTAARETAELILNVATWTEGAAGQQASSESQKP